MQNSFVFETFSQFDQSYECCPSPRNACGSLDWLGFPMENHVLCSCHPYSSINGLAILSDARDPILPY